MQLDHNYDRNAVNNDMSSGDFKYKENYTAYSEPFTGEVFDCEVLLAQLAVHERTSKKGGTYQQETLSLVLKIKEKFWIRVNIKGAFINKDGTSGRNPVQLHDFLCLADRQHKDCLADASTHTFDDGTTSTSYPHLYGLKFKLAIATVGEFKGYDVNSFYFYDISGKSAVELETGSSTIMDLKNKLAELQQQRNDFLTQFREAGAKQDTYGNQVAQALAPQEPNAYNNNASMSFANEDIPF